jgi:hypothetical protein
LPLTEILNLVGPLDDGAGPTTARERFRTYLADSVKTVPVPQPARRDW